MKVKIPTLQEALKITENNPTFYYKEEIVNNRKFYIFNYRLCSYSDFDKVENVELRGITYDEKTEKPFLSMHKFFNDQENPFTMTNWDENKKYLVREKLDGSLIQAFFINDDLFVKTKGTFFSEQAKIAKKLIKNNKNLYEAIKYYSNKNYHLLFEYISPINQIVIQYPQEKLILIQVRNNDGIYMDYEFLENIKNNWNIDIVDKQEYTLKEIRELQKTTKGIEGWVVYNKDVNDIREAFRKFKTNEYFELHKILAPDSFNKKDIIIAILNETIDDIMGKIEGTEKYNEIKEIREKINRWYNNYFIVKEKMIKDFNNLSRKEFALKWKDNQYFSPFMLELKGGDIKKFIEKQTNTSNKAEQFLKNL